MSQFPLVPDLVQLLVSLEVVSHNVIMEGNLEIHKAEALPWPCTMMISFHSCNMPNKIWCCACNIQFMNIHTHTSFGVKTPMCLQVYIIKTFSKNVEGYRDGSARNYM